MGGVALIYRLCVSCDCICVNVGVIALVCICGTVCVITWVGMAVYECGKLD